MCKQHNDLKFKFFIIHRYKGPDRKKMYGPVLDRLYAQCCAEQSMYLATTTGYGRAITGDGATILGTKYINFLCHEFGKGAMLMRIKDCTDRLRQVGSIESTFIAHEMINAIRLANVVRQTYTMKLILITFNTQAGWTEDGLLGGD